MRLDYLTDAENIIHELGRIADSLEKIAEAHTQPIVHTDIDFGEGPDGQNHDNDSRYWFKDEEPYFPRTDEVKPCPFCEHGEEMCADVHEGWCRICTLKKGHAGAHVCCEDGKHQVGHWPAEKVEWGGVV